MRARAKVQLELGRRFAGVVVPDMDKRYEVREVRWVRPGGVTSVPQVALFQVCGHRGCSRTWKMVIEPVVMRRILDGLGRALNAVEEDPGGFVPEEFLTRGEIEGEAPAARVSPSPRPASPGGAMGDGETRDAGPLRTGRA